MYPDLSKEHEAPPDCPTCGGELEWETCWQCGGKGGRDWEELQFEDPLWYDEDDFQTCDICDGEGGYWFCGNTNCAETIVQQS